MKPYPAYKNSGVAWIGEVPEGWEIRKLKWLSDVRLSNVDKKSSDDESAVQLCNYVDVYYNEKITPDLDFMTATARTDQIEALSLEQGDVLITKDSESPDDIAVPAFVPQTLPGVVCGYHLAHIRPYKDRADGNYLARSFIANGIRDQFEMAANGITRFGIGKQAISDSLFVAPPLPEQTAIAAYLDRKTAQIDTLIEQKRRFIQLLQEERTALISQAVTKGLAGLKTDWRSLQDCASLPRPRKMKDSGVEWIGEVPEGWGVASLGYVCGLISGGTPDRNRADYWNGDIPWVKTGEVSFNTINDTEEYITNLGQANSSAKFALPGTILMAMYGQGVTRGRVAILGIKATFNQACLAIIPGNRMDTKYLFYYLMNAYNFVRDIGNETSQMNLSSGVIAKIKVLTPHLPEQIAIAAYLDQKTTQIDQTIVRTERQIELLQEYRTALISAAVTGKIDVREETGAVSKTAPV